MIIINQIEFPWREGMTLDEAVKTAQTHPALRRENSGRKMFMQNGKFIQEHDLANVTVCDHDEIVILDVVSGG